MTPNELRAEAEMVDADAECGIDTTTRACLFRAAADEIEQLRRDLTDARLSLNDTRERIEEIVRELDEYKMEMRDE